MSHCFLHKIHQVGVVAVLLLLLLSLTSVCALAQRSRPQKILLSNTDMIEFPYQIGAGIYDITGPAAESMCHFYFLCVDI